MLETVAVIISFLGGAFVAYNVSGKAPGSGILPTIGDERKRRLQGEITRILTSADWASVRATLLTVKVGGPHGIPASSESVKMIIAYWAGINAGPGDGSTYYQDLGYDMRTIDGFNAIAGGTAGRWVGSDYNVRTDFNYPEINQVSLDEGNDFGLARNTGTWLEETFNLTCLSTAIGSAIATVASGGTLGPAGVAGTIYACRTN